MKNYLSIIGFLAASSAFAQNPTVTIINSADVAYPNFRYEYYVDTTTSNFDPGIGGSGWTTDFTTLNLDESNTIVIHDILQTPYASQYPQGNIVLENSYGIFAVAANTSNSFSVIDEINPAFQGFMNFHYLRPDTMLKYNLTLFDSWMDSSSYYVSMFFGADPGNGIIADSIRIITGKQEYTYVDGEGTCLTESGSYTSLRLMTAATLTDYTEFYQNGNWVSFGMTNQIMTITYTWWAKTSGLWVAQCEVDPLTGEILNVSRLASMTTTTGVAEESSEQNAHVYPNPASDILTIETGTEEGFIEIADMTGRIVVTSMINSNVTRIDVTGLASGMYMYRVNGVAQGKVQVAH